MSVSTFEGVVENGAIRLRDHLKLPEKAKVYVVIPDFRRAALTFSDFAAQAKAQGQGTPAESAAMVREDRDAGHSR